MTSHLYGQGYPAHLAGGVGPGRGRSPASCGAGGALETRLALVAAPLWVQGVTAVLDAAACQSRSALFTTRAGDVPASVMAPLDVLTVVLSADLRVARPVLDVVRLVRFLHPQATCLALVPERPLPPTVLLGFLSELGVEGVLGCRQAPEVLVQALRAVRHGEVGMTPDLQGCAWRPADFRARHAPLTDSQRHLLMLLLSGWGYREVADHLGTTTKLLSGRKCTLLAQLGMTLPVLIAAGHRLGAQRQLLVGPLLGPRKTLPPP